jgi:hypothetical protein
MLAANEATLPIVHRDDFFLAVSAFAHPELKALSDTHELLVTYIPWKAGPTERVASGGKHCLHYVMCEAGTLERYYEDERRKRQPAPELLFGSFKFDGAIQVEVNDSPVLSAG